MRNLGGLVRFMDSPGSPYHFNEIHLRTDTFVELLTAIYDSNISYRTAWLHFQHSLS